MTLDEIRKKHNVGASTGQTTEKPVETNTDAAGLAAIRKRHNVDNYVPSVTEKPNATTPTAPKAEKKTTPAGPVNIKAFGAYGSNGKQETTSRAGKTVNAGAQGTMSNFTNLFGWLKEADAMAAARDEADRAYTAQQNKELVESKGEKATAKTSTEQKKVYNEAHAKQKDTWSKYYKKADELSAMSEKNTAEAKEGLGAVGQTLVDLGVVGTQMVGDAAANFIAPGGGTASMIARVAGGAAQQARLEGKDIGDQSKAAVKSGAISFLTEKMFGAFGKLYGKGAADDIVEKIVGKIGKSNAGRNALRLLLNSAGEGVEEMTEDLLNAAADKVLKLGDGKVDVGEVLYDGLLGFMMGGFGGVPQIFNGNYRAKNEALQMTNMQKVFAKTVAENAPDAETAQAAQAMVEKIENGGSLEAEEVAALVEAMDAIDEASQAAATEQAEEKPLTPVEAVVRAAKGEVGATQENAVADPTIAQEATTAIEQAQETNETSSAELPEGMGAASADFTGDMTPAEQWVAEAQGKGDSALHPISDEQQQNLAEQQGRAPQELPKVDPMGNLTSKTASTLMNSGITSTQMSEAILNDAAEGKFSRIAYSDMDAVNKAESEIENGDGRYQGALIRWQADVEAGKVSKDTVVMGICLYNNAVQNGDLVTAMNVAIGIADLAKNGAQATQAVRILNKLSPEGRIYVAAKATDKINRDLKKRYGDKIPDIAVDETLYSDYLDALKSEDKVAIKEAWKAIEQNIADQIPSSWIDKLNAWRYLSMLGNLRTHGRNIFGNVGFMPVRMAKNVLGAGIESVANRISPNGIERTKAVLNPFSSNDQALLKLAWGDYENSVDQIMSNGKYNDTFSGVEDKRTIFDTPWYKFTQKKGWKVPTLEAVRKANSNALNAEDSWFSQPAYAESLASWLKANGYNAKSFTDGSMPVEKLDAARAYAVKEAQKATYRDLNFFSKWVSSLRIKTQNQTFNRVGNAIVEGVLPFKKTPANILVRAVEYSPIGAVKTLTADSVKLRREEITAAEYIDNLSQGLTGTALVGLGYLFAQMGVLSGGASGDDKQDAFDELQGKQDYSMNIGDLNITLDWLAPESMPLFVGVELFNKATNSDEPFSIEKALKTIEDITSPMLNMSMLQGVNEVIEGLDYADGSALSTLIQKATGSLISQFVPTIFGQLERTFTENRQTTFVDRNSSISSNTQRFIGNLLNKVPGIDYNQIDYIDAWGRTEDIGDVWERGFNNLLNPSYVKKSAVTDIDDELQRLHDAGVEEDVFPKRAEQSTKINGNYLTADQYVKYAKERGSLSLDTVTKVIRNPAYRSMTDAQKAKAVEYAYSYANYKAKLSIDPNTKTPNWVKESSPLTYIMEHAKN